MWFLLRVLFSRGKLEVGVVEMDTENTGISKFEWKSEAESGLVENLERYPCFHNTKKRIMSP